MGVPTLVHRVVHPSKHGLAFGPRSGSAHKGVARFCCIKGCKRRIRFSQPHPRGGVRGIRRGEFFERSSRLFYLRRTASQELHGLLKALNLRLRLPEHGTRS